ncbi:MAG: UPF0182 family protein, partial [Acidobacteria bacterium]|nr:UPF0182 family protein [Acidobacteriota bacterium]
YRDVFITTLAAEATVGGVAMAVALGVLLLNLRVALRTLSARELVLVTRDGPMAITVDRRRVQAIGTALALVVALLFGLYASGQWQVWLMFRHAQRFGDVDPVLGKDVGFYILQLPFLDVIRGYLFALVALSFVAAGAPYVIAGAVDVDMSRGLRIAAAAKRHLAVLAAAMLLVLAFGAYLDVPRLLTTPAGIIHGAANVDVAVRIPALRVLTVAALAGAALALYQLAVASWWPIVTAAGLYIVVAVAGSAGAAVMHRFVIAPNEQARETPFIERNIAATRRAFALDDVEERELSGDTLLTRADIDANDATLGNVRLWDHQPLLQTFAQIQEIRTYYDFVSVHNDRYMIDGAYRQIMLSARELNSESLPNRNWINERLTFTHGYGLTLGPVNQVTPEGLPVLFIKDIPPQSAVNLRIGEPSIYYGQLSNDHVFVKTKAREFHYPRGDDNVYTTYEGTGGVPVSNFLRRLLFSIRFQSFKVLFSNDITNESRVMFHRRLSDRVARIAPFLQYDPDPYLVISNGRLLWLQDGYTVSGRYPYSSPAPNGINYIRNSVKATVDAYHGTVTFYLIDEKDPIALTLQRIFPALFRPLAEMPKDMRARLRYPEGIFTLQAAMYATYHMTNPAVFYNKEDLWDIPTMDAEPRAQVMQPYYTIMRLPGEPAPEFIQMLPFTPARKDNLASWMVARSDGEHYGRMRAFQFPKQKVVFGPRQIVARINQDQAIAPQITLWNQQGSEVLQGTLLVIPVEESLLYVRPLYLRSAGGRIPELKRVIVAHQNQIVMEETLEKALERLFPSGAERAAPPAEVAGESVTEGTPRPAMQDELSARALEHYRRALQAQREGNWAVYGEEIRRLGEVLNQMKRTP